MAHFNILCEANRKLVVETHHRIARSRRLLNPAWGISGASRDEPRYPAEPSTLLHIERWSGDGADPATSEYIVSFGGSRDGVGTVLLSKRSGLLALRDFLESLGVPSSEVEAACRVLAGEPRHEIPGVKLTQATLRGLRL